MKQCLTKSSESGPPSKKNRVFGPPGPSDIIQDTDSQPMQPVLVSYPQIDGRNFQASWYQANPWLEYSQKEKMMFCYSCRHFANSSTSNFRIGDVCNFKKVAEKIQEHSSSESHAFAMESGCSFSAILRRGKACILFWTMHMPSW